MILGDIARAGAFKKRPNAARHLFFERSPPFASSERKEFITATPHCGTETFMDQKIQKKTTLSVIRYWMLLCIGNIMVAAGIYFFKAPNGFAFGGVSGISILLAKLLPVLSQATYMTILNVLLLLLGILFLGRGCGIKTILCAMMISLVNQFFETFLPISAPLTTEPLLELVFAVLLTGFGSAILFNCNASSGGTDIIALILKKYTNLNVGQALLIADIVVAASTFFVYDVQTGLFSVLGLFSKVFLLDDVIENFNMCKAFTVITTKPEEIDDFIFHEMDHSATLYDARGAYSGTPRKVMITVCKRFEAPRLRKKIKEIDPHAFIIITKTSEILGKGFLDA